MEYYADLLARSGTDLLPLVQRRLERCPSCPHEYRRALYHLSGAGGRASSVPAGRNTAGGTLAGAEKGR